MNDLPFLSIVMPAYNEEHNLETNTTLLINKLDALDVAFELLIVDDCSTDATPEMVDALAAHDRRVRVFHHPKNCGIGQALYTGFEHARGTFTIFIPADLAMDLDELPKYLNAAEHADIVVGLRSDRHDSVLSRKIVSLINIGLLQLLFRMPLRQFQYICMYRTRFLQEVELKYRHSAFIQAEVLIKARDMGYKLTQVTVGYIPRTGGVARGAKLSLVIKSVCDILTFWVRWLFKKRENGQRDWRAHDKVRETRIVSSQ
ncbi:MAG: glycosyltransferase family 2 protein [Anaerolineae bacterium]|nr:glycosyltransferase family 2 protein [Anaerolineae bacterium]